MRAMTEDRVADVIEMRHLRFIEQDAILELARVPHHDAISDDHIFAYIAAAPDMTVLSDPRRPFQDRALLYDRAGADENCVADKWLAHQFAEHRRLQAELEVTRDLPERVPNIFLRFEKFRVRGVFEAEKFR